MAALEELFVVRKEVESSEWSAPRKLLFRIACLYLLIYSFPYPLDYIPFVDAAYTNGMNRGIAWIAEQVLDLKIEFFPMGSGDTTFNYVQLLCYLGLSIVGAIIWSLWIGKTQLREASAMVEDIHPVRSCRSHD